jgi:uncharacterized membrane protein
MKHMLIPALLLAAGCASTQQPYAPVRDVAYSAIGAEPFWLLTIGDDRIVLRTPEGETSWPRPMRSNVDGVRTWESGEIRIIARPGPCGAPSERVYEDDVSITLPGRRLSGCGGRIVRARR